MIVYKTTNLINGKIYIGQDSKNNENYYGSGILILRAIEKFGIENFSKEILEECNSKSELDESERRWIKYYNSQDKNIGYNIVPGGTGGPTRLGQKNSKEQNEKISASNMNKKMSEEAKSKISRSKKGKPAHNRGSTSSEETREKIRKSKLGKKASIETRKKLSEIKKGKKLSQETKEKLKTTYSRLSKEDQEKRKKNVKIIA